MTKTLKNRILLLSVSTLLSPIVGSLVSLSKVVSYADNHRSTGISQVFIRFTQEPWRGDF